MPIKPTDFLSVAETLHAGKVVVRGEPCDRTTAGRLYYAVYLALRDVVRSDYGRPALRVEHAPLRKELASSSDPIVADVGARLDRLYEFRRRSDYELAHTVSRNSAALLIADAKAIFAAIPRMAGKIPPGIT